MSAGPGKTAAVAVLGGRGFVGSAIVAEAADRGLSPAVVEVDNYENLKGMSCDVLVNANGNSRKYLATREPAAEFQLSVTSVLRALTDFHAAFYIHLSSIDVYPDVASPANNAETAEIDCSKISEYGLHKYMAEMLARRYAKKWTIVRMAGFVGKGLWKNSVHDLLTGKPLRVHPDSRYQYMDTRVMAGIVCDLAAKRLHGEVFNVAGRGLVSPRDVAAMIPGAKLVTASPDVPREHYEINIGKISALCEVPTTAEAVAGFVRRVRAGEALLK